MSGGEPRPREGVDRVRPGGTGRDLARVLEGLEVDASTIEAIERIIAGRVRDVAEAPRGDGPDAAHTARFTVPPTG